MTKFNQGFFSSVQSNKSSRNFCGLYYKDITIVNDDSSITNELETSLIDDRVVICDHHMFIVQATGVNLIKLFTVGLHSNGRLRWK